MKRYVELEMKGVEVAYGNTLAFAEKDLSVRGRIIAVIGHNGSGKSTLLKSLLQLLVPRKGRVDLFGWEDKHRVRLIPERHMAFSPENGAVFEDLPVESYIKLWCRIKCGDSTFYKKAGAEYIDRLNVGPLFSKLGRELSKGQRRRIQAVVGFISNPNVFLFDEPFDGLDILQSTELASVMLDEAQHRAIIVSSHRMEVVERVADLILVLKDGRVHAHGAVDEVCRILCGQSIMVSNFRNQDIASQLIPLLRKEFCSCLINQIGHQLVITGNNANMESVDRFLKNQDLRCKLDAVRPSLVDAMHYHLDHLH